MVHCQGVIETIPGPGEQRLGANGVRPVLSMERNYLNDLVFHENQYRGFFDTNGCTIFSGWDNLEIIAKKKYNEILNKSDRFTVVISGNDREKGNYLNVVGDSIKTYWSVDENEYPFPPYNRNRPFIETQAEYYQPISEGLKLLAKQQQRGWEVDWYWVDWGGCLPINLMEGLKYGPLQITVATWGVEVNGIFQRLNSTRTNHAVTLVGYEYGKYWIIHDQYDYSIKKLAWDYYIGSALQYSLEKTMARKIKGDRTNTIFLVGKSGKLYAVGGEGSYLNECEDLGLTQKNFDDVETLPQAQVDAMPKGRMFGFIY